MNSGEEKLISEKRNEEETSFGYGSVMNYVTINHVTLKPKFTKEAKEKEKAQEEIDREMEEKYSENISDLFGRDI